MLDGDSLILLDVMKLVLSYHDVDAVVVLVWYVLSVCVCVCVCRAGNLSDNCAFAGHCTK
jgi:hypothetical protein